MYCKTTKYLLDAVGDIMIQAIRLAKHDINGIPFGLARDIAHDIAKMSRMYNGEKIYWSFDNDIDVTTMNKDYSTLVEYGYEYIYQIVHIDGFYYIKPM